MSSRKLFGTWFLFILCVSADFSQSPSPTSVSEAGFLRRSVSLRLTTIDFRVHVPAGYDPAKKYPVILYLHGRGARGNDNEKQIGGAHLGSVIQPACYPGRYYLTINKTAARNLGLVLPGGLTAKADRLLP
jgi:hypothetical protein